MRFLVLVAATLLTLAGCSATPDESEPLETATSQSALGQTQVESQPEATNVEEVAEESDPLEAEPEQSTEPESNPSTEPQEDEGSEETEKTEAEPTQAPSPSATEETVVEPEVVGYTLAEVSKKNTAADCWVAIDGGVYDLTMWVAAHPGGGSAITQLCGTDGTDRFLGQHGGQARPSNTLDSYYIGPLL